LNYLKKLLSATLQSNELTFQRLKYLSKLANSSEDHISRLCMGLSISNGEIVKDWKPSILTNEEKEMTKNVKLLKGKTLFKDDLELWMALVLQYQEPNDYNQWRKIFISHWERGVELLTEKAIKEKNWIKTLNSCIT